MPQLQVTEYTKLPVTVQMRGIKALIGQMYSITKFTSYLTCLMKIVDCGELQPVRVKALRSMKDLFIRLTAESMNCNHENKYKDVIKVK